MNRQQHLRTLVVRRDHHLHVSHNSVSFLPQMAMSQSMSRRIRAVFNTFNFWSIVLYNILALNSPDFAKLVAKRLLLKGKEHLLFYQTYWGEVK